MPPIRKFGFKNRSFGVFYWAERFQKQFWALVVKAAAQSRLTATWGAEINPHPFYLPTGGTAHLEFACYKVVMELGHRF